MPVLVYCVQSTESNLFTCSGVDGKPVRAVEDEGLRCYLSDTAEQHFSIVPPLREGALTFHRVTENIFEQGAIIPFRFPTVFPDASRVIDHLAEHSAKYRATLERLRNMVQMEIRLQINNSNSSLKPGSESAQFSGTEYLRNSQRRRSQMEEAARRFLQTGSEWINRCKQRPSLNGLRLFVLIPRDAITKFENKLQMAPVPPHMTARLSGPWPATQFFEEQE